MLNLQVDDLIRRAAISNGMRPLGRLLGARELLTARIAAGLGDVCDVLLDNGRTVLCEVVGCTEDSAQLLPFENVAGLRPGQDVVAHGRPLTVPTGRSLLGRVLDGLGRPVDGGPPVSTRSWRSPVGRGPSAMVRPRIDAPLETGVRVIDGLLTCGRGQRMGLFAGSGVGKSTLLGEIAKTARADLNVIALVGERGREVRPFLDDCLGEAGRQRSVVVLATSEETPLMRIRAMQSAVTIADSFRHEGANVLLMVDSITRLAFAQREIGLLRGEPPGPRGYTPSVFQLLASVLEQLGTSPEGSITGLITVLVDGDDMDEPIADAARSILDGHIVLDRKLAARGHFPAVDVLRSVSRLFTEITPAEDRSAARGLRECLAAYTEMEDLIQLGAYQPGGNPRVDRAVQLQPAIIDFLRQDIGATTSLAETRKLIRNISAAWQQVG